MKSRISRLIVFLLVVTGASVPATADWIRQDELESSCAALLQTGNEADGSVCRGFVHGFLLGSESVGASPADPAVLEQGPGESYSERALRTRVTRAQVERVTGTGAPDFCLGEEVELVELVRAITDYMEAVDVVNGEIRPPMVREALRQQFPCEG